MFERCWETQCQWVHPNQKLWDCRLQGQTNPERAPDQRTQIWMNLASGILTWSCHKVRKCGSSSPASGHTDFWMGPSRFRWHRPAKRSAGSAWKKHQYSQALTQADLHWSWRSNIVANHTIAVSILAKMFFCTMFIASVDLFPEFWDMEVANRVAKMSGDETNCKKTRGTQVLEQMLA